MSDLQDSNQMIYKLYRYINVFEKKIEAAGKSNAKKNLLHKFCTGPETTICKKICWCTFYKRRF